MDYTQYQYYVVGLGIIGCIFLLAILVTLFMILFGKGWNGHG